MPNWQLADELRARRAFRAAAVGGGSPDPGTTLNQVLLALRARSPLHARMWARCARGRRQSRPRADRDDAALHAATARMLIARIDYALPGGTVPVPDL
jgi:hypothetical protein